MARRSNHWSLTRPIWNALHIGAHYVVAAEHLAADALHHAWSLVMRPQPAKRSHARRRAASPAASPHPFDAAGPEPLGSHSEIIPAENA